MSNIDHRTVDGFGDEWERFDQSALPEDEARDLFDAYFHVFPWSALPADAEGFDLGCGSGRWAAQMAPRVGKLHCIDPSSAIEVARRNLARFANVAFHRADAGAIPLAESSMDFGYSLGVLHHIPDTELAMKQCVAKLKPGAPFLVYLYYRFDNRPAWFWLLWRVSDVVRRGISRLPHAGRFVVSQAIAATVYWPLARAARLGTKAGHDTDAWPLSMYQDRSFYTMRTDALDRFGTRLEHRYTRAEITGMMHAAGLDRVTISPEAPYWCAVGYRAR